MTGVDMVAYGVTEQHTAYAFEYGEKCAVARVLSQEKGCYRVIGRQGEQLATLSGKLRYNAESPASIPTVGDFVLTSGESSPSSAVIHAVLPRKSIFIRKAAGTTHTQQAVAANIDTVFICTSPNNDFNLRRLERYISATWESGAAPVVVLTKADLCSDPGQYIDQIKSVALDVDILFVSANEPSSLERLAPYLKRGKTVAFIGSSGVGKSTLINTLLGREALATDGLRNDDRGKHTTTRRELFLLEQGAMVIDTPGMRELGLWSNDGGLEHSFSDIEALAAECRFSNCSHSVEPGCAIRAAIASGELDEKRWLSFQKLTAESRYSESSCEYLAKKREKFRNISKTSQATRKK